MLMKKIVTHKCPHCGCVEIVEESSKNLHTNGDWNEYRVFRCGYKLHYIPNFKQVFEEGECIYDPDVIERKKSRKMAVEKLERYINRMFGVDKEFKNTLILTVREVRR